MFCPCVGRVYFRKSEIFPEEKKRSAESAFRVRKSAPSILVFMGVLLPGTPDLEIKAGAVAD